MTRIKFFIKTTLMGGTLIVLPLVILILVFNWFYEFITDIVKPLTVVLIETVQLQEYIAAILSILIILSLFFTVGLIVKTRIGKFTFEYVEQNVLVKIPLYKIIKETTLQLVGSEKTLFKHVALVNLYSNETLVTAFVTDEHEDGSSTVFVPSGPAPTAGFIYHLKKENVHKIKYPVDKAMKTIFSLGVGSNELLAIYNENKKLEEN